MRVLLRRRGCHENIAYRRNTSTVNQEFDQSEQGPLGKIAIKSPFGEIEDLDDFLVINMIHHMMCFSANHGCTRIQLFLQHTTNALDIRYEENKEL